MQAYHQQHSKDLETLNACITCLLQKCCIICFCQFGNSILWLILCLWSPCLLGPAFRHTHRLVATTRPQRTSSALPFVMGKIACRQDFYSSPGEPGLCNVQIECMKTIEGGTQRSSLPSEEKQISLNLLLLNRSSKEGKTVQVVVVVCLSFYLQIPDMYSIMVEYVSYIKQDQRSARFALVWLR